MDTVWTKIACMHINCWNRRFIILAMLVLLLAACGGRQELVPTPEPTTADDQPIATSTPADTRSTSEDPFPVTIEHKFGTTEIPEEPERIVSVGYSEQDFLLALGVTPLGVRDWYGDYPHATWPWAQDELGDAEPEIIGATELDMEAIAALDPDLIVGVTSGMTADEYDLLSQIAPTVAQPAEYVDYGTPWPEVTRILGRALGRSDRAEAIIAGIEERYAEIRAAHPEFEGATVAVAFNYQEQPGVYASQDTRSRLLRQLGFTIPAEYDELAGESFFVTFSEERMPELLDVDVIVWIAASDEGVQTIRDMPLRPALDPVQEGREVFLGQLLGGAFSFSSPLSIPFLLDELVPMLAAAVDGDPDTVVPDAAAEVTVSPFPVTVEHKFGTTEIPEQPQRVVTVGFSEQDPVLALGVTPVGVREWFGEQPHAVWPWAQDELGDAEPEVLKMPFGELNYEAIAALQPDLLVATHSGITEEEYETLSQIAPTLAQSGDYPDFGMPWQEQTRLIGRALGRAAQAETLIADAEAQIAAARDEHPEFEGATVAWASPADQGQYWAVGPNTPPMRFLADLGFQMPAELADVIGDLDSAQISSEQLTLLDADVLIFQTNTAEERAAIEDNPLYQSLDAAQEGRTIFFVGLDDPIYGALSFSTVLSIQYAVDNLVPQLAAAVDGDPATEVSR